MNYTNQKNITMSDISDIITSKKKDMKRMMFIQSCIDKDIIDLAKVRSAHKTTPELQTLKSRSRIFADDIQSCEYFLETISENTGIVQEVKQSLTENEIDNIKTSAVQEFLDNLNAQQSTTAFEKKYSI